MWGQDLDKGNYDFCEWAKRKVTANAVLSLIFAKNKRRACSTFLMFSLKCIIFVVHRMHN